MMEHPVHIWRQILISPHHDEARVHEDERARPADAGGAVDDGRAHAFVQTAAVPHGAEELEEGVRALSGSNSIDFKNRPQKITQELN